MGSSPRLWQPASGLRPPADKRQVLTRFRDGVTRTKGDAIAPKWHLVMGYDTKFTGRFAFSRPLTAAESAILEAVHEHCHQDDLELPFPALEKRPLEIEPQIFESCYIGEGFDTLTEKYLSYYRQWTLTPNKRSLV